MSIEMSGENGVKVATAGAVYDRASSLESKKDA